MKERIKHFLLVEISKKEKVELINTYEEDRLALECECVFDLSNEEDCSLLIDSVGEYTIKKLKENYKYCLYGSNFDLPIGISNLNSLIESIFDDMYERMIANPELYKISFLVEQNKSICNNCKHCCLNTSKCNRLVKMGGLGTNDVVASNYKKGNKCDYFEKGERREIWSNSNCYCCDWNS